jgi:alpha-glucosidase
MRRFRQLCASPTWRLDVALLISACWLLSSSYSCFASPEVRVISPDRLVQFRLLTAEGRLSFAVSARNHLIIEPSVMSFTMDGVDLTGGVEVGTPKRYRIAETYPWLGAHARATNHCNGATVPVRHRKSGTAYTLEVRAFNDGVGFRFVVPGGPTARVPDEATTFIIPAGSTVWHHDLGGHYEGVHTRTGIADLKAGTWAAPPVTFTLAHGAGYAAITEADLVNYSGMALQADGHRGLRLRLAHSHPVSYPFKLRYSAEDIDRLSRPAAVTGTITTPWRVVLVGADLNTLVNSDIVPNLCPAPDPKLFPQGPQTSWIKPGRAVWKYLDGGGSNSFETAKEFTRLAGELGFEHQVIEGYWSRWSDEQIKELVAYANQQHVGIWVWKHSKSLRDPQARHDFLKRCHDLGITGVKIDFFDHEAKEVIDLYQALLKEAAEQKLLLNFHGANKPAGEARTWPNELNREAIKGMEASRLADRATHDVTLPFTRLLAGHADYTPVHFGQRRANTTWGHQVASAVILGAPLLTYAAHPTNILANPCCDMIKSIPAVWDETLVMPPSEIGEVAVFARRSGTTWFLAVMNGTAARKVQIPLSFLGKGNYPTALVRDKPDDTAAETVLEPPLNGGCSLTLDLRQGGGFVARFTPGTAR